MLPAIEKTGMPLTTQINLADLLTTATVSLSLRGRTKQEIIDELLALLDRAGQVHDLQAARRSVIEREKKLSTGLGRGIAVPHGKTTGVERLVGAFGIHREGVWFDAADGHPCTLFFMILSPVTVSGPHVKALADIAKHLRKAANREQLMKAETAEAVLNIFTTKEL